MTLTLQDLSKTMREIDFTMLSTRSADGRIAARPMSNNGDVEYDGDSWFFAMEDASAVTDIERDPTAGLTLQGATSAEGAPGIFISIEATAEIIRDKAVFREHWVEDLERWFKDGVDTPGLTMIKARAASIRYWKGEDEGEIEI
jgi:general stress protein 26